MCFYIKLIFYSISGNSELMSLLLSLLLSNILIGQPLKGQWQKGLQFTCLKASLRCKNEAVCNLHSGTALRFGVIGVSISRLIFESL